MDSIAQLEAQLRHLFGPVADQLAKDTGFIQRSRVVTGSSFAQSLVCGWLHWPDARVEQLCQALGRTSTRLSPSGLSQRFTPAAQCFLERLLSHLLLVQVRVEPEEVSLLHRFSAVIVEDSTQISLPAELAGQWPACGNGAGSQAGLKLHVQWDLLSGQMRGPILTSGRTADQRSPLRQARQVIPEGAVYLCDNGYFGLKWLAAQTDEQRYVVTRPRANTAFFTLQGQRLSLQQIGPTQVGDTLDLPVLVGTQVRWPARLIMVRVPEDVVEHRQARIRRTAQRHSREADPAHLELAQWTILITNVPTHLLSTQDVVIMQRARWQIERLFRLWKEDGLLDEWQGKKPIRIICEILGKLLALLLQQWMLQLTCWSDPRRSLVKAGAVIRDEAWSILRLLRGRLSLTELITELLAIMGSTCRVTSRRGDPCLAQLLTDALSP